MNYNRGGKSLLTGDIGRMKIMRQHLLLPGETMRPSLKGNVRLAGLRQQSSVYLHASIEAFAAPLRWYQSDFTDYIKEGVATAKTIDTLTGWNNAIGKRLGVGFIDQAVGWCKFYAQHPINIFNEHYRWPEDAKFSVTTPTEAMYGGTDNDGPVCVNLPAAITRLHDIPSHNTIEEDVTLSGGDLNVIDLAKIQARFGQSAKSDWSSQDRYIPFLRDIWKGAQGSNEVDQVPIKLRSGATLSVSPSNHYATDGDSLGEIMSLSNFSVDHKWAPFTAPEHMIVAYIMVLRFVPVFSHAVNPILYPADMNYETMQGDHNVLAGMAPVAIKAREMEYAFPDGANTIGYLPAGWQWREPSGSVISHEVDQLNNFPIFDNTPHTATGYRDASNIGEPFRTQALRDWFADLNFNINVHSQIMEAGRSIMAGALNQSRGPKGNHPTGGFVE